MGAKIQLAILTLIPNLVLAAGPICTNPLTPGSEFRSPFLKDLQKAAIFTTQAEVDPKSCQMGFMGSFKVPYKGADGADRFREGTGFMVGQCLAATATANFVNPGRAHEARQKGDGEYKKYAGEVDQSLAAAEFTVNGSGRTAKIRQFFLNDDFIEDAQGRPSAGVALAIVQHRRQEKVKDPSGAERNILVKTPVNQGFKAMCSVCDDTLSIDNPACGNKKEEFPGQSLPVAPRTLGTEQGRDWLKKKMAAGENMPFSVLGAVCKDGKCEWKGSRDDAKIFGERIFNDGTMLIGGNSSQFGGRGTPVTIPTCMERDASGCKKYIDAVLGIVTHTSSLILKDTETGKTVDLTEAEIRAGSKEYEACEKKPESCYTRVAPISAAAPMVSSHLKTRSQELAKDIIPHIKKSAEGYKLDGMSDENKLWVYNRVFHPDIWEKMNPADQAKFAGFNRRDMSKWSPEQKAVLDAHLDKIVPLINGLKASIDKFADGIEKPEQFARSLAEYDNFLAKTQCDVWY